MNINVYAAVYVVAAVVYQRLGDLFGNALFLCEVLDHVVHDGLDIVAVNVVGAFALAGCAVNEVQLLGDGFLILLLGDVALEVHLLEDVLLPFLIVFGVLERVILRRQVGYADDGSALRKRQLGHVLSEVGLRRSLNAVAALSEEDDVKVPFEDILLIVLLFKLKRLEDLQKLTLYGDIVLMGDVFDELLCDRRAAEGASRPGEHIHERTGGPYPVNAVVIVKALVLDSYEGLFHVIGNVASVDPNALLLAGKYRKLLPFAAALVLIPHDARLLERYVVKVKRSAGNDACFDVVRKDAQED